MTKQSKRYLSILCAAVIAPAVVIGPSVYAQSRLANRGDAAVAARSDAGETRSAQVATATSEPRVEILLLQAQRKHEACTAEVEALMDQAYDEIFRGADIPIGGDEAMLLAK